MIWYGNEWKYDAMDFVARRVLSMFSDCSALEIACGYGRHSDLFRPDRYLGIDFSEEMIKLAKQKHPEHRFAVQDATTYVPTQQYDIIYGVMDGGHSKRFFDYCKIALVIISPVDTIIRFKNLN